jgi:hypothetical protein
MARALPLLVLLAACGSNSAPPAQKAETQRNDSPRTAEATPRETSAADDSEADDAAEVLRTYYARIEAGDYEGAARLRSRGQADAERLANNFKAYRTYHVQIGAPGRAAESKGWLFVNVPVMITGSFKGGQTFGSAGSVTLRRAARDGPTGAERGWHVYTG